MFDNQFFQPDQILPDDQPPEILEITAEPYPDKRRVKILFRLTSFLRAPNASLNISDEAGETLAAANLVNITSPDNEITLHLPAYKNQPGEYSVTLELFSLIEQENEGDEGPPVKLIQTKLKSSSCSFSIQ